MAPQSGPRSPFGAEAGEKWGLDRAPMSGLLLPPRQHAVGGHADPVGAEALAEDHPLHRQGQGHVGAMRQGLLPPSSRVRWVAGAAAGHRHDPTAVEPVNSR